MRQVVIALGGNALLQRGQPPDAEVQLHNVGVAAEAIATIAQDHTVIVTHGNGPQVGLLALLVQAGAIVVCAGGGGIPVAMTPSGRWDGVEAVIDKDLSAALLATDLGVDALLLLTDVDAVYGDWSLPSAYPLRQTTPDQLRGYSFAAGSMGPKVEAVCRFIEAGGTVAGIGQLHDAAAILAGEAGTVITVSPARLN